MFISKLTLLISLHAFPPILSGSITPPESCSKISNYEKRLLQGVGRREYIFMYQSDKIGNTFEKWTAFHIGYNSSNFTN